MLRVGDSFGLGQWSWIARWSRPALIALANPKGSGIKSRRRGHTGEGSGNPNGNGVLNQAHGLDPSRRMSLSAILVFALSTLPTNALGVAILVYLSPYFASHLGVPLTVVGAAFFIVRWIDFFVDPLLGMMMDRTRTRLGRYRVWQIIGIPILMLAVAKLFLAPYGISEAYMVGWLLVLYLGSSILDLSRSAWSATLATQYHERSRVFGIMTAVAVLAAVAVLLVPILSARSAHGGSSVPLMGWFIIALTPLGVGIAAALTPERVNIDVHTDHFPLSDYWALVRRPALIRLFLAQLATSLGPNWMSAMYLFFFTQSRGFTAAQASIMLAVYILSGVAGAPATAYLARRIGKHRAMMVTTTAFSLGLSTAMLFPKGNVLADLPMMIWCGFMASGFGLMIGAMAADFGDEIRLDQGKGADQLDLRHARHRQQDRRGDLDLPNLFGPESGGLQGGGRGGEHAGGDSRPGGEFSGRANFLRHARRRLFHRLEARRRAPRRHPQSPGRPRRGTGSGVGDHGDRR